MIRALQLAAVLSVLAFAGACAPSYHATLQEIDEVRELAERTASDVEAVERAAWHAQAAADEALEAANAAQACCDAASERLDRMFEASQAK